MCTTPFHTAIASHQICPKRKAQGYPYLNPNLITAYRWSEYLWASSSQTFLSEPRRSFTGSWVTACTVRTGVEHSTVARFQWNHLFYHTSLACSFGKCQRLLSSHCKFRQINCTWGKQFIIKAEQSLNTCRHMITWYTYYKCKHLQN